MQIDLAAIRAEFNTFPATDVLAALNGLGKEPLRKGKSDKVTTGRDGSPAGVGARLEGGSYHFRVTLADGVWHEVSMTEADFSGFVDALQHRLKPDA